MQQNKKKRVKIERKKEQKIRANNVDNRDQIKRKRGFILAKLLLLLSITQKAIVYATLMWCTDVR